MNKRQVEAVPLSIAAHRLRRSYGQTLRLVLIGHLHGWQDSKTGRWWVEVPTVAGEERGEGVWPGLAKGHDPDEGLA